MDHLKQEHMNQQMCILCAALESGNAASGGPGAAPQAQGVLCTLSWRRKRGSVGEEEEEGAGGKDTDSGKAEKMDFREIFI